MKTTQHLLALAAGAAVILSGALVPAIATAASVDVGSTSWLVSDFNTNGIGDVGTAGTSFDDSGAFLPRSNMVAAGLAPDVTHTTSGLSFVLGGGTPGTTDLMRALGQTVDTHDALGAGAAQPATKIALVGAAVNANQPNVSMRLNFAGSSQTVTFDLTDWCTASALGTNVAVGSRMIRAKGNGFESASCGLWATAPISIPAGQKLESITFPSNPNVRIMAIASDADTSNATVSQPGPVTLSSPAKAGEVVTAAVSAPSGSTVTYEWSRNGTVMGAVTGSTYTPSGWDAGATLTVRAVVTKSGHRAATAEAAAGVVVAQGEMESVTAATLTGQVQVGQEVAASPGTYSPSKVAVSYQWMLDGQSVSGAQSARYLAARSDAGKVLSVKVSATADGYSGHTQTLVAGTVAPLSMSALQAPAVEGAPVVGSQLTTVAGVFSAPGVVEKYQWLRDGQIIPGQTAANYRPTAADAGRTIGLRVTAVADGYAPVTILLNAGIVSTAVVTPATSPAKMRVTAKPVITRSGKTVTAKTRVKVKATLKVRAPKVSAPGAKVTYQWLRSGKVIKGATKTTYKVTKKDRKKLLVVKATVTAPGYQAAVVTSKATSRVR